VNGVVDYRSFVEHALSADDVSFLEVERVLLDLGGGSYGQLPDDEGNLLPALDCFQAIRELEPDDGAHPWNQGWSLKETRRHVEAAALYLRAAELGLEANQGAETAEEEHEWTQTALWHAVNSLLAAGRPLTATVAARRIDHDEYRDEAEQSIREWLAA
jgi:hypothetical protein